MSLFMYILAPILAGAATFCFLEGRNIWAVVCILLAIVATILFLDPTIIS